MPEIVLIRGVSGSGKSTIAKQQYEPKGYIHIEADQFFEHNGKYTYNPKLQSFAHKVAQRRTEAAMKRSKDIVVANTFTCKWEMEPYEEMAKKYNYPITIIIAKGNYPSVHGVPLEKIEEQRQRFEE